MTDSLIAGAMVGIVGGLLVLIIRSAKSYRRAKEARLAVETALGRAIRRAHESRRKGQRCR